MKTRLNTCESFAADTEGEIAQTRKLAAFKMQYETHKSRDDTPKEKMIKS